jgi:hypothetical protein
MFRKRLVAQHKISSFLKIFWVQVYSNNYLQNMQTTIMKRNIKKTKLESKLDLLKVIDIKTQK